MESALFFCRLKSLSDTNNTIYLCARRDYVQKKQMETIQDKLRKFISVSFSKDKRFKRLDKKELIKEDLLSFVEDDESRRLIEEFKDFTTYFSGFNENRHNMYVSDASSTAIAYRLIHENLPRFIDNMNVFDRVVLSPIADKFPQLAKELEEHLNVRQIEEVFRLDYYNMVLSQTQIDVYNAIIGGKTLENGKKIQGLNEYINLYNQNVKDRTYKLPKFKLLYKQILSDRNVISWLPEKFNSDNELLESVEKAYRYLSLNVFEKLRTLLINITDYDKSKIYLKNDTLLTNISKQIFGQYDRISNALFEELLKVVPRKSKKENDTAYKERVYHILKSLDSVSITAIESSVVNEDYSNVISRYFASIGKKEENDVDLFAQIEKDYINIKDILNVQYPEEKNLVQDKHTVDKLKNLLDDIKALQLFIKPLLGCGSEPEKDARFYGDFLLLWEELDKVTPLYNMVRNYVTRKPYSVEKIKLNFENSTLMSGWDVNKEHDNTAVIMRDDTYYYLAIMNKKFNKVFDTDNNHFGKDFYEKMDYKLLPGANKMLPKVFFSASRIDEFAPGERIIANYEKGTHKKGENFSIKDCHELIDFFKESICKHSDWSNFDFKFSNSSRSISTFSL